MQFTSIPRATIDAQHVPPTCLPNIFKIVVPYSPAQPSIHVDVASAMGSGASGNPPAPGPAALQKAPNTGLPDKIACRFNDVDDVIRVREDDDPAQTPKLKIKD